VRAVTLTNRSGEILAMVSLS